LAEVEAEDNLEDCSETEMLVETNKTKDKSSIDKLELQIKAIIEGEQ